MADNTVAAARHALEHAIGVYGLAFDTDNALIQVEAVKKAIDAYAAAVAAEKHNLQRDLLDLITLMPDSQTQELVDYIAQLRAARAR